ncbi:receptor-like protein EIX1 [Rosa sericea]
MEHRHKSASISLLSLVLLSGILYLETVTLVFCNADVNVRCMSTEMKALLKLKDGLTDPSDRLSSWVGEDCCKWRGVGCNNTTGRVESLNLRNSYSDDLNSDGGTLHALGGEINPSLLDLKDIVYLDLSMNNFGGIKLPSFIGSLEKLKYLNISRASFGGVIPPNLGNLSRLLYLDLSYYLVEAIENDLRWLPSLSSLKYLDLGGVDLTKAAGYWLPTVNMLPSLVELHLSTCGLSILPLTLPYINFTSLSVLDLSINGFNSTIPPWLFNLTELVHLDLKSNSLRGMLPETFGRLTSLKTLDLSENSNIDSQLPRNLGLLCNLQTLKLSVNKISGEITEFLDSLSGCAKITLETLDLGYNNLSGNLPNSLGYLKSLRYLKLWYNSFHGRIPESIGNLTSLEDFYLTKNQMSGAIPESFGQLSSLVALEISDNKWEGVVTEAHFIKLRNLEEMSIRKDSSNISLIFNISSDWIPPFKLRYLSISSCQLGPKFPTWLRNQTELFTVGLINSRISDTIPDWFWQLNLLLDDLDFSNNQLSGRVPNSLRFSLRGIADLSSNHFEGPLLLWSSNISGLYLNDNLFSGPIPHNIGEVMPLLEDLDISRNFLTGRIPLSIGNLSRLTTLVISNNHLSGEVPNFWKSLSEVYIVDMSNNSLSGAMPISMGFLSTLRFLILSNNKFSGKLPLLKNCTGMKSLDLGENKFSGDIPAWIGESMLSLWILRLSSNLFTGNIPSQLCGLSNLHILDLSNNDLVGHIPLCVGNLSGLKISEATDTDTAFLYQGELEVVSKGRVLQYDTILYLVNSLDLSNNNLSGELPVELTSLIMLGTLNLSMNHLTGIIPEKIGNLKSIETLDLSMNKLSGSIPQSMVSLTFVTHLNLSHNNLSGRIPTSNQFNSLIDPSIYQGNAGLCGSPLPTPCRDNEETPQAPREDGEGDDGKSEKVWLMISIAIGFILGFWVVFGSLVINKTWRYAYFRFLDRMKYAVLDFVSAIGKCLCKRSGIDEFS